MSRDPAAMSFDAQAQARLHGALRFAAGVTAAFVGCEVLQLDPTFLAPVLAAALLANLPMRPPLKLGVVLVLAMAAAATFAFVSASLLRTTPLVLFLLLSLCMLMAFHAMLGARSRLPFILLLICLATIPVVVLVAPAQAGLFPRAMVRGIAIALVVTWAVYAVWPRVLPPSAPPVAPPLAATPLALALMSTAVVVPLMLVFLLFGLTDIFPVMLGTVILVINFDLQRSRAQAVGLILGNVGGGLLGLLIHGVVLAMPNLVVLTLLLFAVLLGLGQRVAAGGNASAIAVVACNAMLIILGSAIASGSGSLSLWMARLFQFALAGAFAVGMMSLMWPMAVARQPSPPTPPLPR